MKVEHWDSWDRYEVGDIVRVEGLRGKWRVARFSIRPDEPLHRDEATVVDRAGRSRTVFASSIRIKCRAKEL